MAAPSIAGPGPAEPTLPRPFQVLSHQRETHDTVTLRFVPADGGPTLVFEPGQFTMIYVLGVGEVPISISGEAEDPEVLTHTVRNVGAVTSAICSLDEGDVVGIRGPYGTGWPVVEMDGKDVVIVAGGIGLAPLRPAIHHAVNHRERIGTLSLVYGARSPGELLYRRNLRQWRSRFDFDTEVTVDRADDDWRGDVGLVTGVLPRIRFDPDNSIALLCGPEVMMKVVARRLEAYGVPQRSIFISLERNMKCAIGFCGHCQFGPDFICKDGPVVSYDRVAERLRLEEV